jgi:rhamnose utilization protein RhaD (predicted bifunctional aldolase and dehydrogenase)
MMLERIHIKTLQNALKDYVERISAMLDDKALKLTNTAIQMDLQRTIDETNRVLEDLASAGTAANDYFFRIKFDEVCSLTKNKSVIASALTCYKDNLENSKKVATSQLCDTMMDFRETNTEISRCKLIEQECAAVSS